VDEIKAESEESTRMVTSYGKGTKAEAVAILPPADEIAPPPPSAPPAASTAVSAGATPGTSEPPFDGRRRAPPRPSS